MRFLLFLLTLNCALAQDFVPFLWDNSSATGNELLNNLLAFWKMDDASGGATDETAHFDMSANGSPGSGTGVVSGSRTFDETTPDYFTRSYSAAFGFPGGALTITTWGQFDVGAPHIDDKAIIARGDFSGTNFSWALIFDNATPNDLISFYWSTDGLFNATNVISFDLGGSVTADYYFICLRWDGSTIHLSATDAADMTVATDTTAAFSGTLWNSGSPTLSVGRLQGSGVHYMRGQLDEMGVWSGYLSDCEVAWLFTANAGSFSFPSFDAATCVGP